MTAEIIYVPGGKAAVYLWAVEPAPWLRADIRLHSEDQGLAARVGVTLKDPAGERVAVLQDGESCRVPWRPGFWQIVLTPQGPPLFASLHVRIDVDGACPFIVPVPGVLPSHFEHEEPWLRFPASPERGVEFYLDVPAEDDLLYFGGWLPGHEAFAVEYPNHRSETVPWRLPRSPWHAAEVPVCGREGWWRVTLRPASTDYHFTTGWAGLPLFFALPPARFPYARLSAWVVDESGGPIDARLSLYRNQQLQAIRIALSGKVARFHTVPGRAVTVASRGAEFSPSARAVVLAPGGCCDVVLELKRCLRRRPGWICGDHHLHSFYEDGAVSPRQIAQAARGEGLDYVFVTDMPEPLLEADLGDVDLPGRFLALPGQELMSPDCHFNALNIRQSIDHPPYGVTPASYPGPKEWIPQVEAQSSTEHPTAYILNHPAHFPEVAQESAYFRSWWLVDQHPEIKIVENSSLEPWYERLNAGRRLSHLWTTDSHDISLFPPGARRTYVYTGGELSEAAIIHGLESGRLFNTRVPGAWLEIEVNGATMGQTVTGVGDELVVSVYCEAAVPLERVEIIRDGEIAFTWFAHGATSMQARASLRRGNARWLIATAYMPKELESRCRGHQNPPEGEGLIAFTNPVYVQTKP